MSVIVIMARAVFNGESAHIQRPLQSIVDLCKKIYARVHHFPMNFAPFGIFCDYFDGDDLPDILIVAAAESTMHLLFNNGNGTFSTKRFPHTHKPWLWSALALDVNHDHYADIAIADIDFNK